MTMETLPSNPEQIIKLYQLPRGSKIITECSDGSSYLIFDHVDGMYSYCRTEKENTVHLSVWTPLRKLDTGEYTIEKDSD